MKQNELIVTRQKEHLTKQLKDSKLNNDQKTLLMHELEMLNQFGIYGISSGQYMFSAGDTIKLTLDYGGKIHEFKGILLLYGEQYDTYIGVDSNNIVLISDSYVVKKELIKLCNNDFYKSLVEGSDKFKNLCENGSDKNYG